jgi:hypothetical protein
MTQYVVTYTEYYMIDAPDKEEAIDLAIEEHALRQDGEWDAVEA